MWSSPVTRLLRPGSALRFRHFLDFEERPSSRVTFEPRPFRAAAWASGPHAQTLLARILRSASGPTYERERIEVPDGDFLDLDWAPEVDPSAPIVLVLHGLEGSAERGNVRSVCREFIARGVRPVVLNFRGCGGEPNRTPHFYHSGETGDPRLVLERIRAQHPSHRIGALGFSLGGNVLLKLLGEDPLGGSGLVDVAAAISVPYDLAAGSRLLEQSRMGRFYAAHFLRSLHSKVRSKEKMLEPLLELEAVFSARTIWEFDDRATAPLNGFEDAAHYYRVCSSSGFLEAIRIPTLLLHAEDDPFLPTDSIPIQPLLENPQLSMVRHRRSGHVGFLEGTPWAPRFWGEQEAARFLADQLLA